MSLKLKLLLGVLIGIVATGFLLAFSNSDTTDGALKNETTSLNTYALTLSGDEDHDGLSDIVEANYGTDPSNSDTDGDGYKDGEEVLSGCDPILFNRNDCAVNGVAAKNLTQYSSDLITGGVVSGDLRDLTNGGEAYGEVLGAISDETMQQFSTRYSLHKKSDVLIIYQNDRTTIQQYVAGLQDAVNTTVSADELQFNQTLQDGINYLSLHPDLPNPFFETLHQNFKTAHEKLLALPIPSDFTLGHVGMLNASWHAERTFDMLARYHEDPIAGHLSLLFLSYVMAGVQGSYQTMADYIVAYPITQ